MLWYGWVSIAISCSACFHIAASLWLMNLEQTPIEWDKETGGSPLNPFRPMRFVLQYIRSFLKRSFQMQLLQVAAAVVWLPLAAVLIGILVVLSVLPICFMGWWDLFRFKYMTLEQRRALNIMREAKPCEVRI